MAGTGQHDRASPAALLRTAQVAAVTDWRELSRTGRASVAGVVASALLAIALGVFIPRIVEAHAVAARYDANVAMVRLLDHHLPLEDAPPSAHHYDELDELVRGSLLGGDNMHVHLWQRDGTIVYSDLRELVGRRLPKSADLTHAFNGGGSGGIRSAAVTPLLRPAALGPQWLEFTVPVIDEAGAVRAAFMIQQDFRPLASHLASIRQAVWIAVGLGLSTLLVFLAAFFAATARAITRRRRVAEDRARDLAVLLETSRALAAHPGVLETVPFVLDALTEHLTLQCAVVAQCADGEATVHPSRCVGGLDRCRTAVTYAALGSRSTEPVAFVAHGLEVLAVTIPSGAPSATSLVLARPATRPFSDRDVDLVVTVAAQIGVAADNTRLFEEIHKATELRGRLLRRLVTAQEEERRHLTGELHDGLGQGMTRTLYGIRGIRARLHGQDAEIDRELVRLDALVEEQSRQLRRELAAIRPASLDDFGLASALESLVRDQPFEPLIELRLQPLPDLSSDAAISLFRAAQEALTNVRRHAGATKVRIEIGVVDDCVELTVADDGKGADEIVDGMGLSYLRDRIESLGGTVRIDTAPDAGTQVMVRVPKEADVAVAARPHS